MEKLNMSAKKVSAHKIFKILKWAFFILVLAYVALVVVRVIHLGNEEKTAIQVAKIHNTKLKLDDVMGVDLPPDPGLEADKTVQGVDANENGIRDDVELAIFREYPDSAKTRAVLLQYALALQMQTIQPIINTDTVVATIQEEDRAYLCVGEILAKDTEGQEITGGYSEDKKNLRSFVEDKQLNTEERKKYRTNFYEKIGSYNSLEHICDIDYSKLPN